MDTTITIGPTETTVIVAVITFAAGYCFAKYPELPGLLQRSVRNVRRKLAEANANGDVPDELKAQYYAAHELFVAFDEALEDGKLSFGEVRRIGVRAYRAGKSLLELIKR